MCPTRHRLGSETAQVQALTLPCHCHFQGDPRGVTASGAWRAARIWKGHPHCGCPVQGPLPPASLCPLCLSPKGDPPALGAVPLAVSLGLLSSCVLQRPLPRRGSSSGARERRPRTRMSTCRTSTSGERLAEGLAHIIPTLLPRTRDAGGPHPHPHPHPGPLPVVLSGSVRCQLSGVPPPQLASMNPWEGPCVPWGRWQSAHCPGLKALWPSTSGRPCRVFFPKSGNSEAAAQLFLCFDISRGSCRPREFSVGGNVPCVY